MRGLLLASVVALGSLISQCQSTVYYRPNNVIPNISTLEGRHFKLTVVHDPPGVDVGLNNGYILPKAQWSGYIVDMINDISRMGDFTYEMYLPSGNGLNCSGSTAAEWAPQYICGQQDVLEQNITDAYWSMYYITPDRIKQGTRFTQPFLHNAGTRLMVKLGSESLTESMFKLFKPYSGELWIATFVVLMFSAGVLFSIEQVTYPWQNALRKLKWIKYKGTTTKTMAELDVLIGRRDRAPGGLFSSKKFPKFLADQWQQLLRKRYDANLSLLGSLLQLIWCFFSMVWVCSYLSQLTVQLTTTTGTVEYNSIGELAAAGGSACVKRNAAYVTDLRATFPELDLLELSGLGDMMHSLAVGRCDGIIENSMYLQALAIGAIDLDLTENIQWCSNETTAIVVGEPTTVGLTELAVGVSSSLPELQTVLSYWINSLQICPDTTRSSLCYKGRLGAKSLPRLKQFHFGRGHGCDATTATQVSLGMSLATMCMPISIVVCMAVLTSSRFWFVKRITPQLQVRKESESGLQKIANGGYRIANRFKKSMDVHWWRDCDCSFNDLIDLLLLEPPWNKAWNEMPQQPDGCREITKIFCIDVFASTMRTLNPKDYQLLLMDELLPAVQEFFMQTDLDLFFLLKEHVELWRVAHEELVFLGICRFYEKGAMQTKDSMRKAKDAMRKANLPCCMCCGRDNVEEQDSPRLEMDSLDADGDGTITLEEFLEAGGSREHFEQYDVDHDGKLGMEEVGLEKLVDISIKLENLICQGVRDRYTESRVGCCGVIDKITVQITDSSVGPELSKTPTEDLRDVKLDHHLQPEQAGSTTIDESNAGKGSVKSLHNLLRSRRYTPPQKDSTISTSSVEKLQAVFELDQTRELSDKAGTKIPPVQESEGSGSQWSCMRCCGDTT